MNPAAMGMSEPVPVRSRKWFEEVVLPMWRRIAEDRRITPAEQVEFEAALVEQGRYEFANVTSLRVAQAAPRVTDERYFDDLVAVNRAAMRSLADAA